MEALAIHTGAPEVHWEDNISYIYVVESKDLLLELKKFISLSVFYNKNLTMVSLLKNMRSIVSLRQTCAPKHVQVQLSVRALNG